MAYSRLGSHAIGVAPTGSFSGKTPAPIIGEPISRLAQFAIGVRRYRDDAFANKNPAAPEPEAKGAPRYWVLPDGTIVHDENEALFLLRLWLERNAPKPEKQAKPTVSKKALPKRIKDETPPAMLAGPVTTDQLVSIERRIVAMPTRIDPNLVRLVRERIEEEEAILLLL